MTVTLVYVYLIYTIRVDERVFASQWHRTGVTRQKPARFADAGELARYGPLKTVHSLVMTFHA